MKIIKRLEPGKYAFKLPREFKLIVRNLPSGETKELTDPFFGVEYWMRLPAHQTIKDLNNVQL